jgi:hypothetical protein
VGAQDDPALRNSNLHRLANAGAIDRKWAGVYVGPGLGPDKVPGYEGRAARQSAPAERDAPKGGE